MLAVRFREGERGMKTVWIASVAVAVAGPAWAQTTIYKHVDESGRVTYSNKPMKNAVVVELEPLTTIPGTPGGSLAEPKPAATVAKVETARPETKSDLKPVAIVTPLASIDPQVQKKRDDGRRKILEAELEREEQSLTGARKTLTEEQQNPQLIAAVRTAQQAAEPTAAEMIEFRKNIEALKKELGALKP